MSEPQPLHILVLTSRPLVALEWRNGQAVRRPIPLKPVWHVRRELERSLKDANGAVKVRYLACATTAEVQAALLDPYDVVHIVGHGADDGRLLLEREHGEADLLSVERAAQMLKRSRARLVVISACHSGRTAQALREEGVANVVAVDESLPIADRAAALFNQLFYGALVRGHKLSDAFRQGVDAVRADSEVGDHHPPLDEQSGEALSPWSARFRDFFREDEALVKHPGHGAYEEWSARAELNLPRQPDIIGREALRVDAIRDLAEAQLVTLMGPGGIGKTTVAVEVAHWHADRERFRDGVLFVTLDGIHDSVRLAEALSETVGMLPEPVDPWRAVRTALAGRDILLVLDNAEGLLDDPNRDTASAVGELGQLLEAAPDLKLLVTSRQELGLRRWERTRLVDEMEPGEAERLFLRSAPASQQVGLALEHRAEVRNICATLAYYPLALVVAAAQLGEAGITPDRLRRDLQAKMLDVLEDERSRGVPERLRSLRASLRLSYERLPGRARIVFFYLGVLPGGVREEELAQLTGKRFEPAAQALVARNLARWHEGRYMLLAPIQAYAIETRPPKRLAAARLLAAGVYASLAVTINGLLQPVTRRNTAEQLAPQMQGRTREEIERGLTALALATFDAELANLLAAVEWAFAEQTWELVGTLVGNLNDYLDLCAYSGEREAFNQRAVEAAKREDNGTAEGIALTNLGNVYQRQGRWSDAIMAYESSLSILRELGSRHGKSQTLTNLGSVYDSQGRWSDAITAFESSLSICRDLGDRYGEGLTLTNLGTVYNSQGALDQALDTCRRSLTLLLEIGDHPGTVTVLRQLGRILHRLGDADTAFDHFAHALDLALNLHTKLVLDTVGRAIHLAKDIAAAGHVAEVARFGQHLSEVVEQRNAEAWQDDELRTVAALCQQVFTVMTLLGQSSEVSSRERRDVIAQALEQAKEVDAATEARWALAAWVDDVLGEPKGWRAYPAPVRRVVWWMTQRFG